MEKHMTQWQEEEQTEKEVRSAIKKAERLHGGKYKSHRMEKAFNSQLNKELWLLEVTVTKVNTK